MWQILWLMPYYICVPLFSFIFVDINLRNKLFVLGSWFFSFAKPLKLSSNYVVLCPQKWLTKGLMHVWMRTSVLQIIAGQNKEKTCLSIESASGSWSENIERNLFQLAAFSFFSVLKSEYLVKASESPQKGLLCVGKVAFTPALFCTAEPNPEAFKPTQTNHTSGLNTGVWITGMNTICTHPMSAQYLHAISIVGNWRRS